MAATHNSLLSHNFRRSSLLLRQHYSSTYHLLQSAMTSLTGPQGYAQARIEANNTADANNSSALFMRTVEDRPYFPLLNVDPSNNATIIEIANVLVASCNNNKRNGGDSGGGFGNCTVITGGLTNALFKVDLPNHHSSVLVRIFGAEGMIDRDEETTNFARLCSPNKNGGGMKVVHEQLDLVGRFGNGRVETWIPNMRQAHHITDLDKEGLALEVARQLARLHYGFDAANAAATSTSKSYKEHQPTLWKVIESWIEELSQSLMHEKFQQDDNASLMELFSRASTTSQHAETTASSESPSAIMATRIKQSLTDELSFLKKRVETIFPDAPIVFCHNDVNAANILLDTSIIQNDENDSNALYNKDSVVIIDYEYGSINYAMYDVANYICEHCGGNDNGVPNYDLIPSSDRLKKFLREYVRERDEKKDVDEVTPSKEGQVSNLHSQVELFQMASNLYWGIWGILQAAGEVSDGTFEMDGARSRLEGELDLTEWDNLRYGKNRLERYVACKEGLLCNNGSS